MESISELLKTQLKVIKFGLYSIIASRVCGFGANLNHIKTVKHLIGARKTEQNALKKSL